MGVTMLAAVTHFVALKPSMSGDLSLVSVSMKFSTKFSYHQTIVWPGIVNLFYKIYKEVSVFLRKSHVSFFVRVKKETQLKQHFSLMKYFKPIQFRSSKKLRIINCCQTKDSPIQSQL